MTKSFNDKLTELLKKDLRFVDEESGELIRSEIVNEALKIDKKLIEALLSEKDIKEKFFTEIKEHWVFEINKFIEFIQDKNFLSDSYTKFKNKIGLNIDDKFLNERKEVSLVWPFKDCVLEGGMTKEDQKRNEIFFNEILAQDEIDRLLDPKVLTNFKRVTAKGEEKVTDFKRDKEGTIRENLIIKGNNLLALHSLKKEFQGKIKLIFLDPPYNLEGNTFGYNDNFSHSTWLTFLKNRLSIAKELLKLEGSLWMTLDDTEVHYAKVLCDEIFERENFVANIIWEKRTARDNRKAFSANHDHILVYAINKEVFTKFRNKLPLTTKILSRYKNPDNDPRGDWQSVAMTAQKGHATKDQFYELTTPTGRKHMPPAGLCWLYTEKKFMQEVKNNNIYFPKKGDGVPRIKVFRKDDNSEGIVPQTIWLQDELATNDNAKKHLNKLFSDNDEDVFSTPKPEELIERIINISSNKQDYVLDSFLGSGTTIATAHKLNRWFIGIEQIDYGLNDSVERMKRVIQGKDDGGISYSVKWKGGGDFIYCELMKHNEEAVDKIESAKTTDSLLKIWKEMVEHYFLNYDVKIKRFNDNQKEFKKLPLEKQRKLLVEMLNKNQLYVNLSEMDDAQFKVSKEDKELNKKFYK